MSDWSLKQWTDQLKSTDEAARHEAAAMLGEQGSAASVGPLLKVSVREAGLWHATDRGEPQEPDFRPLCRTALAALQALAPQDILQARADLMAWREWKAADVIDRGARPERRGTPIGALVASLANTHEGAFEPEQSARAAWVLGEVGWELRRWDHFLGLDIDWAWFVTITPERQGPTPRALIDFMVESKLTGAEALAAIVELRALIGAEMTDMLAGLRDRRIKGEPSNLSPPMREITASLGRLDHTDGADVLLSVLRGDWVDLHTSAIIAAGQLKIAAAVPKLLRLLPQIRGVMRARIATALGLIGERAASRPLLSLLSDDDPTMRTEAARALGRLGVAQVRDRVFQCLLDPDETVRFAVGIALGRLGDARTVPFLLRAIEEGDAITRQEAEKAMEGLGNNALTSLVQILRGGKPPYRAIAATRLGDLADPRSIRYLIPALLTEDCQLQVADALHRLGEPAVLPLIAYVEGTDPNLEDTPAPLKEQAARVLGKLGDARAVPPLLAIVRDDSLDERLREEAARVLGKLGDQAPVPIFIEMLHEAVKLSNALVGNASLPEWAESTPILAEAARSLGSLKATSAVAILSDCAKSDKLDDSIRQHAIEALGEIGDSRGNAPLVKLLDPKQGYRRIWPTVIQALGKLKVPEAIPNLMRVAEESPRTYLNSFAIRALSQIGEPNIIPLILRERGLHQELPRALRYLGDLALSPLVDELRTSSRDDVRALAAIALGELGERQTMGALIQALQDPSESVQKAAARSLARLHAGQ